MKTIYDSSRIDGFHGEFGKYRKLGSSSGKLAFDCPICGLLFERYASSTRRSKAVYCGRACAGIGRRVRIDASCLVCGKVYETTPAHAAKVFTCSKKCSSIRKRSRGSSPIESRPTYAWAAVQKLIRELSEKQKCSRCSREYGPWKVRGIKVSTDNGDVVADGSKAFLLCADCHFKEIGNMGAASLTGDARARGERSGTAVLDESTVREMRRLRDEGMSYQAIADKFNIGKRTALCAVKGISWSHVEDE